MSSRSRNAASPQKGHEEDVPMSGTKQDQPLRDPVDQDEFEDIFYNIDVDINDSLRCSEGEMLDELALVSNSMDLDPPDHATGAHPTQSPTGDNLHDDDGNDLKDDAIMARNLAALQGLHVAPASRFTATPWNPRKTKAPSNMLDPTKVAFRFAPKTTEFECIWVKDKDWKKVFGPKSSVVIQPKITFANGKFNACPKLMLTFDYTSGQRKIPQAQKESDNRTFPRTYGAQVSVQPGVTTVTSQLETENVGPTPDKRWEIKSLTISRLSELDPLADRDIIGVAERNLRINAQSEIWVVKLLTEGGLLDSVWSNQDLNSVDTSTSLVDIFKALRLDPSTDHTMIFEVKTSDKVRQLEQIRDWWIKMIKERLPPQSHVIDAISGEVAVGFDSDAVDVIGNHTYAHYENDNELEATYMKQDLLGHPVQFPNRPESIEAVEPQIYFSDPRDLEARLKLGLVQEQHFVAAEINRYSQRTARVMVVKAMDWMKNVEDEQKTAEMTRSRYSYYVLVMRIDAKSREAKEGYIDDFEELTKPPERTAFRLYPIASPPHQTDGGDNIAKKSWVGHVFNHPSSILKDMGVEFCIFATTPTGSARFEGKIYDSIEDAKRDYDRKATRALHKGRKVRLGAMYLEPRLNIVTETREFDAITKVCDLGNTHLRHIQMPLLFANERLQQVQHDVVVDASSTTAEQEEREDLWSRLTYAIDKKLSYTKNKGHALLIESLRSLHGSLTMVTGPAGAGKTSLASHMAVLLVLLGHRVTLQAREYNAVDNMAFEFEKTCDSVAQCLVDLGEEDLAKQVLGIQALRYDTSAFLDMNAVTSAEKESSTVHESKQPDHESYKQTPAYISEARFLSELEAAQIGAESQPEFTSRINQIEYIKSRLTAMKTLQDAQGSKVHRKSVRYPGSMSITSHVQQLRFDLDKANQGYGDHDAFFKLRDRVAADEELDAQDVQDLQDLTRHTYQGIIKKANVVFCTIAAAADSTMSEIPGFDFAFFDEAGKMSIPTGVLGISRVRKHAFLMGDTKQIGVNLASNQFNAMSRQLSRSILQWFVEKSLPTVEMTSQYRCPPNVFNFIKSHFYGARIVNDPVTQSDEIEQSDLRTACRTFSASMELYDPYFRPANKAKRGSLFIGYNVPGGVTLREEDSTSKSTYGECEAALQAATQLVADPRIKPSDILIMTYYKSNVDVMIALQEAYPETEGVEIRTVESCQGRSVKISIVVFGATQHGDVNKLLLNNNPRLQYDLNWRLTPYVLSPERLNVSISRSTHMVIFVANFFTLGDIESHGKNPATSGAAVKSLATWLVQEKLVVDSNVTDQNPRLGLANNPGLRRAFQRIVEQKEIPKLGWLAQRAKETRLLRHKEQVLHTKIRMPEIMGTSFGPTASIPGALNQESQQRQSKGRPRQTGRGKKPGEGSGSNNAPPTATQQARAGIAESSKRAREQGTAQSSKKHENGKS